MILFISPHLDDVALSCGGLVSRLVSQGRSVIIATVCTADTPAVTSQPLSSAAKHVHWEWQLGDDNPYALRRTEDLAACKAMGATPLHLGLPDAVYRHDDADAPLYTNNFIGGDVQPHDWQHVFPRVKDALQNVIREAQRVYCPLGIGGHVDHVVVRQAVEELSELGNITFYEDFPYADKTEWHSSGVTDGMVPMLLPLTEAEITARITAIANYPSQLFALFGHVGSMPERVRNYIAKSGNGENYWMPIDAFRHDG